MQVDINRKINDPFARYKMPSIQLAHHGKTKTMFKNLNTIASSLNRSPSILLKYMSYTLGTSIQSADEYVLKGLIPVSKAQDSVYKFIDDYVLCGKCENPETKFEKIKGGVGLNCYACGHITVLDKKGKIYSLIEKEKKNFEDHKKYIGEDFRDIEGFNENLDLNGKNENDSKNNNLNIDEESKINEIFEKNNVESFIEFYNSSQKKDIIFKNIIDMVVAKKEFDRINLIKNIVENEKGLSKTAISYSETALIKFKKTKYTTDFIKTMIKNDICKKNECIKYFNSNTTKLEKEECEKIISFLKKHL